MSIMFLVRKQLHVFLRVLKEPTSCFKNSKLSHIFECNDSIKLWYFLVGA